MSGTKTRRISVHGLTEKKIKKDWVYTRSTLETSDFSARSRFVRNGADIRTNMAGLYRRQGVRASRFYTRQSKASDKSVALKRRR